MPGKETSSETVDVPQARNGDNHEHSDPESDRHSHRKEAEFEESSGKSRRRRRRSSSGSSRRRSSRRYESGDDENNDDDDDRLEDSRRRGSRSRRRRSGRRDEEEGRSDNNNGGGGGGGDDEDDDRDSYYESRRRSRRRRRRSDRHRSRRSRSRSWERGDDGEDRMAEHREENNDDGEEMVRRSRSRDKDRSYRSRRYRDRSYERSSSSSRYRDRRGDDSDYNDYDEYDDEDRRYRRSRRSSSGRRRRSRRYESDEEREPVDHSSDADAGAGASDGDGDDRRKAKKKKRKSGWDEVSNVAQPGMPHAGMLPMMPPGVTPMMPPGMIPPPHLAAQFAKAGAVGGMPPTSGMMGFNPMMNPHLLQQRMMAMMQQQQHLQQQHQQQHLHQQPPLSQQARRHNFNPDTRIYVGNINFELTEEDLRKTFEPFGEISNIVMSHDAVTGKHRGFCFIDFTTVEDTHKALQTMNGFELGGRNIKVSRPNSSTSQFPGMTMIPGAAPSLTSVSSPQLQSPASGTPAENPIKAVQEIANRINAQTSRPSNRIYIGSLHWDITEDQIVRVFSPFGSILSCTLIPNPETGKHKGYGFIEYSNPQEAQEAIKQMDGFELGGRTLKVGPALSGAVMSTPAQQMRYQQQQPSNSLSQEENMTISSNQRYAIMQKLAKSQQKPTRCVLLTNMVGPEDVDKTLEDELMAECNKFGSVDKLTIYQEKQSEREGDVIVKIFILFQTLTAAEAAAQVMEGRFFGGRQIQAEYFDEEKFLRGEYSN